MKIKIIAILSALLLVTSCGTNYNKSGPGFLYTETVDPLFVDNSVRSVKEGKACSKRILALVATGDSSIEAAKRDARIRKVSSANTEYLNVLGVYGESCTVVKGE